MIFKFQFSSYLSRNLAPMSNCGTGRGVGQTKLSLHVELFFISFNRLLTSRTCMRPETFQKMTKLSLSR